MTTLLFLLSFVISGLLLWSSLRYGVRTQPAQFFFYFACVLTGGVTLRSVFLRKNHPENYEEFEPDLDMDKVETVRKDHVWFTHTCARVRI